MCFLNEKKNILGLTLETKNDFLKNIGMFEKIGDAYGL